MSNMNIESARERLKLDFLKSPLRQNRQKQMMSNFMAQSTPGLLSSLGPNVSTPILNKMLPNTPNKELVELSPNLIASNLTCDILPSGMIPTTVLNNLDDSSSESENQASDCDSEDYLNKSNNQNPQTSQPNFLTSGHRTHSVIQLNRSSNIIRNGQFTNFIRSSDTSNQTTKQTLSVGSCNGNNSIHKYENHNHNRRADNDIDKIERKRERNRLAAKKCRQKKMETIEELRKTVSKLEQDCFYYRIQLDRSKDTIGRLVEENSKLRAERRRFQQNQDTPMKGYVN